MGGRRLVSLVSGSGEVVGYRGCRNDPSGFVKRGGISWPPEEVLASDASPNYMELIIVF